jgi:hypothetical protein
MKTPKTGSSERRAVVIIALLAATTIVTVSIAIPIVKPAYAQLDDINEQVAGEEIPELDDIREKVEEEITSSQSLPRLAELGIALFGARGPPAFAD